jgi:hypothetical protein
MENCLSSMSGFHSPATPNEWSAGMLQAAGKLTIDIAQRLLRENLGLKDATPYNVLFRGPAPFLSTLFSFEKRDPRDTTWLPYAQFVRTFLFASSRHQAFRNRFRSNSHQPPRRVGAEEVYRWMRLSSAPSAVSCLS